MRSVATRFGAAIISHKTLSFVLAIQGALIAFRMTNLSLTGFMTSDEANYILRSIFFQPYGNRYFFDYELILLFRTFRVDTLPAILVFLPFYLAFWSFLFIVFAYKTVGLVTQSHTARNLAVFSLPFMISYSLLSTGVLSEMPGLTTCMIGIYFWLRYFRRERKWYWAALSSAAFVAAAYSREPYIIFPVVASLFWILWAFVGRVEAKHALLFLVLAAIVALPTSPIYGSAQTVSAPPAFAQPPVTTTTSTIQTITSVESHATTTTTTATSVIGGILTTVTTTVAGKTTTITTTVGGTTTLTTETLTSTQVTTVKSLTTYVSSTTEVPNRVLVIASQFGASVFLFALGMVLGWGPIPFVVGIAALAFVVMQVAHRKVSLNLLLLALLSFGTFYFIVLLIYNDLGFLTGQGISYLIRLTNPTIPAFVLLSPFVLEKLSERKTKVLAILLVGMTAGAAGFYISSVQSNFALPYNVLDFNHPSAQLEARSYFMQNSQGLNIRPVILSWDWEAAQIYLKDVPGIIAFPTIQDSNFSEAHFESLHPSTFYVLSESPLRWDNRSSTVSNVRDLIGYDPPVYLSECYAKLFDLSLAAFPRTPFTVTSVQVVFSSPTGHLLEVHLSWVQS